MSVFTSRRSHAILAAATAATACALLGPAASAPAAIVFDQDFSSSNNLADYISATPNSGQFNDISTEGQLATVSVANGALVFDMFTVLRRGVRSRFYRLADAPADAARREWLARPER